MSCHGSKRLNYKISQEILKEHLPTVTETYTNPNDKLKYFPSPPSTYSCPHRTEEEKEEEEKWVRCCH